MRHADPSSGIFPWHRKYIAALLLLVLLSGCASIPLGTLWKMRSFDAADLAKVQPEQVQLAGKIDPLPLTIDPARSYLSLTLTPRTEGARDVRYTFGLRAAKLPHAQLLLAGDPRWQAFEFDEEGIAAWKRLQPELIDLKTNYQGVTFKFEFKTNGKIPAGTDAFIVSAKLQLGLDQQPLTLMDRTRVQLDQP